MYVLTGIVKIELSSPNIFIECLCLVKLCPVVACHYPGFIHDTHERYQSNYQKAGLLNPESHDVYMLRPFAFARPCQTMLFSKPSPEGPHTSTILSLGLFLNHGTGFHYLYNCGDESLV